MKACWGMAISGFTAHWRIPQMPANPSPDYLGPQIRGILGQALFAQTCPFTTANCRSCTLAAHCHYPNVFKPLDPTALPAYILHDWWLSGQTLAVTVLLLGKASTSTEPWVRGLHRQLPNLAWFGKRGMRLEQVVDWRSGSCLFERGKFTRAQLTFCDVWPSAVGQNSEIKFITPLASKHQQADPLIGALKTRLQRLRNQFGDGEDFAIDGPLWHCQIVMQQSVKLTLGNPSRQVAASYYKLQLNHIDTIGSQLLGAGLWLHAGAQTGIGLGRYCME